MSLLVGDLPELRNSRCVRFRFRYSQCDRCVEVCPPGAITPGEEGVELDVTRCTGCGLCVPACPVSAFHQPTFPASALAKPAGKQLAVACKPSGEEGDLHIPCLGNIEPALLCSLAMRNIAVTLRGAEHCSECHHAPQGAAAVQALRDGMEVVAGGASTNWLAPSFEQGARRSDYRRDRRQLFRRFGNRAVESIRSEIDAGGIPESAIRAAAHYLPPRRELAERILERVDDAEQNPPLAALFDVATIEPLPGRCTGCEACARVCPTGALKSEESQNRWQLRFRAARCVGCGVCIESCGPEALQLESRWRSGSAAQESGEIMHELGRYRCESCGRFFIGLEEERCPVCLDDEENFDAIFG